MRLPRASCIAVLLIASGGTARVEQSGVPCYYDWTQAPRQHFMIADSPEYKSIVTACRQGRAETVPWDQHIRMFQSAADMRALAGDAQANLLRLVDMLRKERDHLSAAQTVRRAIEGSNRPSGPPAPAPGDANRRLLDVGPLINQPVGTPDRFTVSPAFRSWVPQFMRDALASGMRVQGRIVHFEGEATIRRGDKVQRVSELLRHGATWKLQAGDIFQLQRGRLIFDFDGAQFEMQPGSAIAVDFKGHCLTTRSFGGSLRSTYLIEGTIRYVTTTDAVRASCPLSAPGIAVSVRGTSFTATHLPIAVGGSMEVTVHSGTVVLEEHDTGQTWTMSPGDSRIAGHVAPPVTPAAPAPGTSQYDWHVQNNCSQHLDFKLFELNLRDEVTGSWKAVSLAAGERKSIPIRPTPGGKVCWGAAARQGNLRWGVGLDGNGTCDRCCSETSVANAMVTRTATLTCSGK